MSGRVTPMKERYRAAMVLAGAGDALGYKDGEWEFCHSGVIIHEELHKRGGLENIKVKRNGWPVSDDTVMHLATAEAIIDRSQDPVREEMFKSIAHYYKECMHDMAGRAPGATCMMMTHKLKPYVPNGYRIAFNPRGGGCGASMRAMCIGLRYPRPKELKDLVAVSIESGRMTHHHPTGYLGALASALFTAYAIQGKDPVEWASGLLDVVQNEAKDYIRETKHYTKENLNEMAYFISHWEDYIEKRDLKSGEVRFPPDYDNPKVRDKFYKDISFGGWGGASGHDSTIIAYDAILGAGKDWEELCKRGVFHGGDSDSTGTIAACCYGAMYGFEGVPENNYEKLEYRERLEGAANELFALASPDDLNSGKGDKRTADSLHESSQRRKEEDTPDLPETPDNSQNDDDHTTQVSQTVHASMDTDECPETEELPSKKTRVGDDCEHGTDTTMRSENLEGETETKKDLESSSDAGPTVGTPDPEEQQEDCTDTKGDRSQNNEKPKMETPV